MDFVDCERRLASLQGELQLLQQAYLGTPERAIIVLEGPDTSGKGGIVRRLGWASIRAASESIRSLRRTNRSAPSTTCSGSGGACPRRDRSSFSIDPGMGAFLVERIEGFATETEWRRAYREINEFERVLVDSGVRLVKLFLHITRDEQRRRFRNRLIDPVKRWKLSYEDFRNRRHWPEYEKRLRT